MQNDDLFNQMANISKAHAYDIVAKQRNELLEEREKMIHAIKKINESANKLLCKWVSNSVAEKDFRSFCGACGEITEPFLKQK